MFGLSATTLNLAVILVQCAQLIFKIKTQLSQFFSAHDVQWENIYRTIAWEPSVPRVLIVTPDPVNIESQNQAKNIPVGLPSSPIKIPELWSEKQTDRQTEITA